MHQILARIKKNILLVANNLTQNFARNHENKNFKKAMKTPFQETTKNGMANKQTNQLTVKQILGNFT